MATRLVLFCNLKHTRNPAFTPIIRLRYRCLSTSNVPPESTSNSPPASPKQQSWLTRKINSSPRAKRIFVQVANAMGYGSPRQVAGRRAFNMYQDLCVRRADEESVFWRTGEFNSYLFYFILAYFFRFVIMSKVR